MELDRWLIWIVVASSMAVTLGGVFRPQRAWGWVVAGFAVSATAIMSYRWLPAWSLVLSLSSWGLFVVAPLVLTRWVARLAMAQSYPTAIRVSTVLRWLHPADGHWRAPELYRALALAHSGQREAALVHLLALRDRPGDVGEMARLWWCTLSGWPDALKWTEGVEHAGGFKRTPGMTLIHLRALGELGQLRRLIDAYRSANKGLMRQGKSAVAQARLFLFSFTGRSEAVQILMEGRLGALQPSTQAFWLATAKLAAGDAEHARVLIDQALEDQRPLFRAAARRRMDEPPALAQFALEPADVAFLEQEGREALMEREHQPSIRTTHRNAPATYGLAAVLVGVFILEEALGGATNVDTLIDMGALVASDVRAGALHLLVTSAFLHYGLLHLVMNLTGLLYFGPFLELRFRPLRLLSVYFLSAVLGMVAVVGAAWLQDREALSVGASGGVMGLVGATAAVHLVGWFRTRSPAARRALLWVVTLLAMQTFFDLVTPEVSFAAHFFGAIVGAIGGAVLVVLSPSRPSSD